MGPIFIGHTRYSLFVPRSAAWRASANESVSGEGRPESSTERYKKYLYEEERLDFRDYVFTNLTVPALASAADGYNVVHFVTFSESLPEKYKMSLRRTAQQFPVLKLLELPDGISGGAQIDSYVRKNVSGVFGKYRLDDDDVLGQKYFTAMARYVDERFVGTAVSLPLGIEAVWDGNGYFNFREAHVPMNSMGLLYVCEHKGDGTIITPRTGAHDKSDRYAPVILDARQIGYLRTNHSGQDNLLRHKGASVLPVLVHNMDKFPALATPDVIEESFPAVSSIILGKDSTVKRSIDGQLNNGIQIQLESGSSGITVLMEGTAPEKLEQNSVVLAMDILANNGKRVSKLESVVGVGTSPNHAIGHFRYFDIEPGSFRAMVSVYLPDGMVVSKARILPLTNVAKEVVVTSVSCTHNAESVSVTEIDSVGSLEANRFSNTIQRWGLSIGRRVLPRLKMVMWRILGQERTDSIIRNVVARIC